MRKRIKNAYDVLSIKQKIKVLQIAEFSLILLFSAMTTLFIYLMLLY